VDQVGNESGFADKVILELLDGRVFFPDQFDGDYFAKISRAELHRFVNQAHSAFRDLSGHLIVEFAEDVFDCCHGVRSARDSAAGKYADWSSARNLLDGEFDSRFPVKHRGRMVTLTARAAARVRAMHAETAEPAKRLRVFVESGGCSGFQYGMSFDELKPDDAVLESEGVAMLLDPSSLAYLSGSLIDFDDGLHGKGFEIKNPNAQSTCGCGKSFN
jgi:iron-sulfur cluster assembly protein/iron-sulfur cluster insertion protein